jgi:hypothetical protein
MNIVSFFFSISANAKAAIDNINKGEIEVDLQSKYVEIIILLIERKK